MLTISPKFRRLALATLLVTATPVIAGAAYLGVQYADGNFHEVVPGELYRSGQPNAAQIRDDVTRYGIRSIVNLRGANPKSAWYRDEIAEAKTMGIVHVDFAMSASKEASVDQVDRLEQILRDVPKPVLIHCQAGSDRTGLAAAVYMHRIHGLDIETAENQISLYYGHIGVPYISRAYPMDQTWERLEDIYAAREREARL